MNARSEVNATTDSTVSWLAKLDINIVILQLADRLELKKYQSARALSSWYEDVGALNVV
jgi:hypothetical protein